jgi:cholesterol oxidase
MGMTILKKVFFMNQKKFDYDYIIIGSGFGGSVAALRLSEKGYRVLVIEKGKWFHASDFPTTNWNLKRWLWVPLLRFFGFFKITYFRHISILSGVGVGGGSLMYSNTLHIPNNKFFEAETWSHLADWESELKPHYQSALHMLGAATNPRLEVGDLALQKLSTEIGKEELFEPTNVAVFFGEPEETVADPYFNGQGPDRAGCNFCGGCMIGCQYNAKNTLDKNYLYLAQKKGAQIQAESRVYDVTPLGAEHGEDGYRVHWKKSTSLLKKKGSFTSRGIIFAGGVLGSIPLLLNLHKSSLPYLSNKIGHFIRTNSESLSGITVYDKQTVFSDGISIGSILRTDEFSHVEPVRYPAGSGAWRLLIAPMAHGRNIFVRIGLFIWDWLSKPIKNLKIIFVDDWAKRTQILLFMQTINTTLRFSKGLFRMKSGIENGRTIPTFIPEAKDIAEKYAKIVNGKPTSLLTEMILGIPLTAHILGGAVMGEDSDDGVIDKENRVFGYKNMYICDGSMISANPGVNPALTITALTERAMSRIQNNEMPSDSNN